MVEPAEAQSRTKGQAGGWLGLGVLAPAAVWPARLTNSVHTAGLQPAALLGPPAALRAIREAACLACPPALPSPPAAGQRAAPERRALLPRPHERAAVGPPEAQVAVPPRREQVGIVLRPIKVRHAPSVAPQHLRSAHSMQHGEAPARGAMVGQGAAFLKSLLLKTPSQLESKPAQLRH